MNVTYYMNIHHLLILSILSRVLGTLFGWSFQFWAASLTDRFVVDEAQLRDVLVRAWPCIGYLLDTEDEKVPSLIKWQKGTANGYNSAEVKSEK